MGILSEYLGSLPYVARLLEENLVHCKFFFLLYNLVYIATISKENINCVSVLSFLVKSYYKPGIWICHIFPADPGSFGYISGYLKMK